MIEEVSILPDWPTPFHPLVSPLAAFPFGLQLVRTRKPLKSLILGLPLELSTNKASRQQLRTLATPRLTLTFTRPTLDLFRELKDLVAESTSVLGIRFVTNRITIEPDVLLCEPLQSFRKIELHLHLPRPHRALAVTPYGVPIMEDSDSPTLLFVDRLIKALDHAKDEVRERYTVYRVIGWENPSGLKDTTRLWPPLDEESVLDQQLLLEGAVGKEGALVLASSSMKTEGKAPASDTASNGAAGEPRRSNEKPSWERQTNLKVLGGFIGLSLESKRY